LEPGLGNSDQFRQILPKLLKDYIPVQTENEYNNLIERILDRFPPSSCNDTEEFACCRLADDIVNDLVVRCPVRRFARALIKHNPNVWTFNFDQPISCPDTAPGLGAFHTDIPWVFGAEGSVYTSRTVPNCTWTEGERNFSRDIITMWTHFAKTGVPTADDSWQRYSDPNFQYLNLRAGNIQLLENVRPESVCDFWDTENERFLQKYFPVNENATTASIEDTTTESVSTTATSQQNTTESESVETTTSGNNTETTFPTFDDKFKERLNFIFSMAVAGTAVVTFIGAVIVAIACPVRKKFYY